MTAQVEHIDEFGTNYFVHFSEVDEQRKWVEWYDGIYTSLFREPTVHNGGKLYNADTDTIKLPLFRMASDFMQDAILGEPPNANTISDTARAWLDSNLVMVVRALQRATRYFTILDSAVWTAEPGLIRAVNPLNYCCLLYTSPSPRD